MGQQEKATVGAVRRAATGFRCCVCYITSARFVTTYHQSCLEKTRKYPQDGARCNSSPIVSSLEFKSGRIVCLGPSAAAVKLVRFSMSHRTREAGITAEH